MLVNIKVVEFFRMTEIILTLSIAGLLVGFIFSMPVAGPISVLIVSNALKGNLRYCYLLTIGASLSDFIYAFIAVFGLSRFYSAYKPLIPYLMILGAIFVGYMGYRIFKSKIDAEHIENKVHLPKGSGGGFHTGLLINFLNPTLFFGWLTSSFIVISIVSSLGFSTGGLESMIGRSIEEMDSMGETIMKKPELPAYLKFDTLRILKSENHKVVENLKKPGDLHLTLSLCFAIALSVGSILWFIILAASIYKFKMSLNLKFLNRIISTLGIFLYFSGMFILYRAIVMIIS